MFAGRRVVSATAAVILVVGFFLPWMAGTDVFEFRTFSGFDFARLIRNFEITADTTSESGQVRAAAAGLYMVPALAINGAVVHLGSAFRPDLRRWAAVTMVAGAFYAAAVLALTLFLSLVDVNEFATVVGAPRLGFFVSVIGSVVLATVGVREMRSPAVR